MLFHVSPFKVSQSRRKNVFQLAVGLIKIIN